MPQAPAAPDLATFKPTNAKELLDGLIGTAISVLGKDWKKAKGEISADFELLSKAAFSTQTRLAAGKISKYEADQQLHFQEVYLNSALSHIEFLAYELAQDLLDAVFGLIQAAIKNWTGIDLNFGGKTKNGS